MINVDAMMALMRGSDLASIGLDADKNSHDPYERLFGRILDVTNNLTDEVAFLSVLEVLREEFGYLPDTEDRDRVQEIVFGVMDNPRVIDDLNESELVVAHDILVNIGVMRTLLYSYDVKFAEDNLMDWYVRYHYFMVV